MLSTYLKIQPPYLPLPPFFLIGQVTRGQNIPVLKFITTINHDNLSKIYGCDLILNDCHHIGTPTTMGVMVTPNFSIALFASYCNHGSLGE